MESNYSIGCFQWFSMSGLAEQEALQYVDNQYPFKSVRRSGVSPPPPSFHGRKRRWWKSSAAQRASLTRNQSIDATSGWIRMSHRLSRSSCCHTPKAKKKAKAGTGRGESIRRVLNESAPVSSSASPAVLAVKYISDWEVSQFRIDTQPQ